MAKLKAHRSFFEVFEKNLSLKKMILEFSYSAFISENQVVFVKIDWNCATRQRDVKLRI